MLSEHDLNILQGFETQTHEIHVLDLRSELPLLYRLYRRAWWSLGIQQETLSTENLLEELPLLVKGSLFVFYTDTETGKNWLPRLNSNPDLKLFWVRVQGDIYSQGGSPIKPSDCQEKAWSTTITVQGMNQIQKRESNLPLQIRGQIPVSRQQRTLQIKGENEFQSMPDPAWFRLPPSLSDGETELELTICSQSGKADQWLLKSQKTGQTVPQIPAPQPRVPLENQRLGIVFDRTCPDQDAWSAAQQILLTGKVPETLTPPGFKQQVSDRNCQISDLNLNLRRQLAQTLQDFFQPHCPELQIDLAWFADTHHPHLAQPRHLTLPINESEITLSLGLRDITAALESCTYSPGLDIWDPVEKALEKLVARFEMQNTWAPVLIIGNSPPNPPEIAPGSPFHELLDSSHTTLRRPWTMGSGTSFPELVHTLEKQGVPVYYLFLHGHQTLTGDERENRAFQVFQSHQEKVERLLSHYVQVESTTLSSIKQGLERIFKELKTPRYSAVKVLQVHEPESYQ